MVARSRKIYYSGIATVPFLCIVFDLHVYINSVKPLNGNIGFPLHFCLATKYFTRKRVCFILEFKRNRMSSIKIKYIILLAVVKEINVLRSAC
jgi:hypothetical protein